MSFVVEIFLLMAEGSSEASGKKISLAEYAEVTEIEGIKECIYMK
jgi:hypothetical protein